MSLRTRFERAHKTALEREAEKQRKAESAFNKDLEKLAQDLHKKIEKHIKKHPEESYMTFEVGPKIPNADRGFKGRGTNFPKHKFGQLDGYRHLHEACQSADVYISVSTKGVDFYADNTRRVIYIGLGTPYSRSEDFGILDQKPAAAQKKPTATP